jgi:hypothetical protein
VAYIPLHLTLTSENRKHIVECSSHPTICLLAPLATPSGRQHAGPYPLALLGLKPVVEGGDVQPGYRDGRALDADSAIDQNLS